MKAVFHLPEPDPAYADRALGNVENLLADGTVAAEAAVIANAGGVDHLLADAPTAGRVRGLVDRGVEVGACSNTLEGADYAPGDLVDGVRVVSSAMAELTRKQADGYAYVRP